MTWFNRLPTSTRVDWVRVLMDLKRAGCSLKVIAAFVEVSKSAVVGWRNLDVEPKHRDGERLIALWQDKTGRPLHLLPVVDGRGRPVENRMRVGVLMLGSRPRPHDERQLALPGLANGQESDPQPR
ncbi:hypothetical protein [Eleftheria terrae]|uniref:hypothetical protein n=1 Tax=Eleftheria terrae TaxID=1597781 RepID=UPI00263B69E2|nr:hypothetical protein [Eleftheria terrae]WKB53010.1 hypothetical protein N7L95_00985 [Eleftheria terrae]